MSVTKTHSMIAITKKKLEDTEWVIRSSASRKDKKNTNGKNKKEQTMIHKILLRKQIEEHELYNNNKQKKNKQTSKNKTKQNKTGGEFRYTARIRSSCFTSGTRSLTHVNIPVMSHEQEKDRKLITTMVHHHGIHL